ncbi:hypothetical protein [Pseudooceanicola sp.]|uniref:hypothetical protein n=1 Tax=Pseudooceanicola sp. TaxID=1914328 RepID=UPI004059FFFD
MTGHRGRKAMRARGLIAACLIAQGGMAAAQGPTTAIEVQPNDYENFTTANTLWQGVYEFELGFHQTNPAIETPGTANQVYFADVAFSPIDGLEFGAHYNTYVDPPPEPIAGATPPIEMTGGGVHAKFRLYRDDRMAISAQVAGEMMRFASTVFGSTSKDYIFIGSAHVPLTYNITPTLQAHFTPGVSVFPSSRGGNEFYGKVASIGAGLSWQPTPRTLVYGTVTQPVTGANTIMSDGSYGRRPVVTVGGRYALAPNSAVEVYATNGFGATPTTGVLAFIPDGDLLLVGAKLVHTFGPGTPKKAPYDRAPGLRMTPRQRILAGDGFTLPGARVRDRGTMELHGFYGMHDSYGGALALAVDHMVELRLSYESIADDGSGAAAKLSSDEDRWTGRFKLQFMDQLDGWPVSLGLIASFGRDLDKNGVFYTALPVMREVNDKLAVRVVPEAAFYGREEQLGLGVSASYAVGRYTNVFGEYTLRDEGDDIWAVGAKARLGRSPFEAGLYATNAIGAFGVNAMTSQEDPRVVLSLSYIQSFFR